MKGHKINILITGITGFVGSHLVDYILQNHHSVNIYGLKRWRSPRDNIKHCIDRVSLHDCDLMDLPSIISVLRHVKPDRIFHLAAQSFVPYSYQNPITTLETNVIGTANLLEAVRITNQDPHIHICSSSEVYGQPEYTPIDESHPLNPISPYGVSKLAEDRLALSYARAYGMEIVITRAFTHTGPRQSPDLVISSIVRQSVIGKQIKLGNTLSVRTVCDVRDIVRAYWLTGVCSPGEVYNIGGDRYYNIEEIVRFVSPDAEIVVDPVLLRPADVTLQIADCSKFKEYTGWEPEISFARTIEDMREYWTRIEDAR